MLLPCGVKINVSPTKPEDIPPEDKLVQAGRELVEASLQWKHSKDFNKGLVKGYVHPKDADDEEPWFCRVSVLPSDEASFDELWFGLGTNKPEHESKFVHNIDKVTLLKRVSDKAEIWNLHYKFPPPVSDRTFTVLQIIQLDSSAPKRSGIIVSIPIDVSNDAELLKAEVRGTRGRYAAVERIHELEDGKTEWRMATSSTPGGSIPSFIVHASTAGQVASDVPFFLKWMKSEKEYFKKGIEKGGEPEEPHTVHTAVEPQPAPGSQPHQVLM